MGQTLVSVPFLVFGRLRNELFQNERASPDEAQRGGLPPRCRLNPTPEDGTNIAASPNSGVPCDVVQFAMFMRLLAPPTPSTSNPGGTQSIANGRHVFGAIGCAMGHTPTLVTGESKITPGLSQVNANLFSDLLVHRMGSPMASRKAELARTSSAPPLWGLGQRIFLLHDGRTTDLLDAIQEHASQGSEANGVIPNFSRLNSQQQQHLLNFLRSL